jgi:formylglycine-generating enzyme required for sulfatase activity
MRPDLQLARTRSPLFIAATLACIACGDTKGVDGDRTGGDADNEGGTGATRDAGPRGNSGGGNVSANDGAGGAVDTGAPFECEGTTDPAEMVAVPEGEFDMGCNTDVDDTCASDEEPQRTISLSAFEIDKTEVTQAQYAGCVQEGACAAPSSCAWDCSEGDLPAGCVTREQADTYCAWAGKRLPTEAEWEKAARGTDGRKYPWGNDEPSCEHVNMAGCGGVAEPVGSHPAGASPYGALDMAGNVVEMLHDWYVADYYERMPESDPTGPSDGDTYVGRGGGFKSEPFWQRTSVRDWYDLPDAGKSLGFRCAR